jgi:hypothetical protein
MTPTSRPSSPPTIRPVDFDDRRVAWLELLPRLLVRQIGANIKKPTDGTVVRVEVRLGGKPEGLAVQLDLHANAVGFGRRWLATCPRCKRSAAQLYLWDGGLCCWRCTGARRLSQRMGHRSIYELVLHPLRRAGELERRAGRRHLQQVTRARLYAKAREALERAIEGAAHLGLLGGDLTSGHEPPASAAGATGPVAGG